MALAAASAGDDIGWFNVGAYHRGIMAGRTPNLDRLASEGMLFTDYYAEASCTAGRANFIRWARLQQFKPLKRKRRAGQQHITAVEYVIF